MDPARAMSLANYELTQAQRRGRKLVSQPVPFRAAYDATAHRVTLTLAGRPKFTKGGRLVVLARPPGGLTDAAGVPLDGGNGGARRRRDLRHRAEGHRHLAMSGIAGRERSGAPRDPPPG